MNLSQCVELFQWMTLINVSVLILTSVLAMLLRDLLYRSHQKLFGIPQQTVAAVSYGYLGMYRLLVVVFNLVPYLALLAVQRV